MKWPAGIKLLKKGVSYSLSYVENICGIADCNTKEMRGCAICRLANKIANLRLADWHTEVYADL
jgi:hypothetical protein